MPELYTFKKCQFVNYILIKIIMENMFYCLLVTFLVSVISLPVFLPRSSLRKEFHLAHISEEYSPWWWRKHGGGVRASWSHCTCCQQAEWSECCHSGSLWHAAAYNQGGWPLLGQNLSGNTLLDTHHGCVSMILNLIRLIIKINHDNLWI